MFMYYRYAKILILLFMTGCMANQIRTDMSRQIHVFGIELYSVVDFREINGDVAIEEPCLMGYERSFEKLDVIIGYGFNGRIRKITSRNHGTSMFGISPGTSVEEGNRLAQKAGLIQDTPYRYHGNDVTLSLLVDGKGTVFGITAEGVD
jgi:hypothetical protein